MIRELNISERKNAENVLYIQISSYKVEAEIIGSDEIPPLKDTSETLQHCGEVFFGYYLQEELSGVLSLKEDNGVVDIHRLIVHPTHFKKGIAQSLLDYIETNIDCNIMKVATGTKNIPAVHFYKKNGFEEVKIVTLSKELTLTYFEKRLR